MMQGCFSNNPGSPITSSRSKSNNVRSTSTTTSTSTSTSTSKESLITCIYLTRLHETPIYLTLTWHKTPYSHTLTIHSPDCLSLTISLQQPTFSLFRLRPGSKSICLENAAAHDGKLKAYYDFTQAEFTDPKSAEPRARYYLALVRDGSRVEFLLGDMVPELRRRVGVNRIDSAHPTLLSRREHVYGRKSHSTRVDFLGASRLIEIDCSGGTMKVKIDGETKLHVKRLAWKFRGNEKMFINGVRVDFYWDVFNWVDDSKHSGNCSRNGVFVFQVGDVGVWPEMVGPEKKLMRKNSPATTPMPAVALSPAGSSSSVWQWAEESSECGRSSSGSSSTTARSSGSFDSSGFSLVLYAWTKG